MQHTSYLLDHSNGNFNSITRDALATIPLPNRTHSYQPVPYLSLLNIIEEKLDTEGLHIVNEQYNLSKNGQKMFGILGVEANDNSELRMSLGLANSYDKSLAVGMVSGAQVRVCTNGMFSGEFRKIRKHTTNFYNDVNAIVNHVVDGMSDKYYNLQREVDKMKEFEVDECNERILFGDILLNRNYIAKPNILHYAIDHWKNPPYEDFSNRNMWSFYNSFTESYKNLSAQVGVKPYIELHKYCLKQMN